LSAAVNWVDENDTIQDAEWVVKAAERVKVKFMVAQVIRFWPEHVKLKEIIEYPPIQKEFLASTNAEGNITQLGRIF